MQSTLLTTKHYASLAAIMLLAPIVPFAIRSHNIEVSDEDAIFVQGYVHYGWYIVIAMLVAGVITLVDAFVFSHIILRFLSQTILIITICMIFIGIFTIVHDTPIYNTQGKLQTHFTGTKNIVLYYIPLYNIFTRYSSKTTPEQYRWKKESILLWGILIFVLSIYPSIWVASIGLIIIVWRLIGLFFGYDLIPNIWKKKINTLFVKHPEELISYLIRYIEPKKHTSFGDEEYLYGTDRAISSLRASVSMLCILTGFIWLERTRYNAGNSHNWILIGCSIYMIFTYIIRFMTHTLSYQPLLDHLIRLFTFHRTQGKK